MSGVLIFIGVPTESSENTPKHASKTEMLLNCSMERKVKEILKMYSIENALWSRSEDDSFYNIIFALESGNKCHEVIEIFKEHDIGRTLNSVMTVTPCSLYYQGSAKSSKGNVNDPNVFDLKSSAWNGFVASVRAHLTIAQVVEDVKQGATLTFDFMFLLIVATVLCAVGMIENSIFFLISSMLMSPMIGPVMAGTFGSVIDDKKLQKTGVQNELFGLGIATLVGFLYGAVVCICTDKYGQNDWPTQEMVSRGEIRTLWVGCLTALLSGAALAVGILNRNIASLVGVAISTSLMPPAVNAGLLWSMASIYSMKGNESTRFAALSRTNYYSEDMAVELGVLGAVSMCLTFVNIMCIYVAGVVVFKIKEVAPTGFKDQTNKQFWKHDIKIARDYNQTLNNEEEKDLAQQIQQYQNSCLSSFPNLNHHGSHSRIQYTWSPCMEISHHPTLRELGFYQNLLNESNYSSPKNQNLKRMRYSVPNTRDESPLPPIQEVVNHSPEEKTCRKKFIVTPA